MAKKQKEEKVLDKIVEESKDKKVVFKSDFSEGVTGPSSGETIGNANLKDFKSDVEKPEMKRLLTKLGYDLKEETELEEERTYTVVHAKYGSQIVKGKTSYDAAKKYAQMNNLKSTAGVDTYLMSEETELTEYFATVHSDKKQIADFIKKNKSKIDYVDDDAGGNIEFEGKGAHELADKIKSKFGVRVTKESFEPLEEMSLSSSERLRGSDRPITIEYSIERNPISFMQTLTSTKAGRKLKHVFPRKMGSGVYNLKGKYQDHIDFLKVLNNKGVMPKNKIIGEELEEDTNKYITEKIKD